MEHTLEQAQLIHVLMRSKDFQEILDAGRALYPHPLMLCDLTFKLLAITKEPNLRHQPWLEIQENGGIPMNHIQASATSACYRASIRTGRGQVETSTDGSPAMLRRALCSGSKVIGYLDSPCYREEGFTPEDEILFDLIADLCCLRMEKDHRYGQLPENMLEFFVADLLEGRLTNPHLIEERLRYFHWNLQLPIQIITLAPAAETDPAHQFYNTCQTFAAHYPQFTSFQYGKGYKMIASASAADIFRGEKRSAFTAQLQSCGLVAGVCRPLIHFADFAHFNLQSEKALALGRLFHPELSVHLYDELAIFHALEFCAGQSDVMDLCHSAIYTLGEYDRNHETNLLETLEAYLRCHMSVPESANRLAIHRNTMSYRLNKIHELIDVNLDNSETVFHLLFSYHILEYYSATVAKDQEVQKRRKPKHFL